MLLLTHSSFPLLDVLVRLSRPRAHLVVRSARHRTNYRVEATSLPTPPPLSNLATSKDAAAAHDWLMRFRGCPIPRPVVDITFSRSSGPGGQVCLPSCLSFHHTEQMMANRMSIKSIQRQQCGVPWTRPGYPSGRMMASNSRSVVASVCSV